MNSLSKTIRRAFVAAVLVGLAIPVSAADKVNVGVFPVSSALPYFVALERGYFKDQGIEVSMTKLMGGPPIVGAMITGHIDAAANLVTIEGMNANLKKPGVVMYIAINGQNKRYQMEQFVVRKGYPARTIRDLKGARILSAPGPANMSMASNECSLDDSSNSSRYWLCNCYCKKVLDYVPISINYFEV